MSGVLPARLVSQRPASETSLDPGSLGQVRWVRWIGLGLRWDAQAGGLRVEDVVPEGPAAEAGVSVGAVIKTFGGARVESFEQFLEAYSALDMQQLLELAGMDDPAAGGTQASWWVELGAEETSEGHLVQPEDARFLDPSLETPYAQMHRRWAAAALVEQQELVGVGAGDSSGHHSACAPLQPQPQRPAAVGQVLNLPAAGPEALGPPQIRWRRFLGMRMEETPQGGLYVVEVFPEGPAEESGVLPGDLFSHVADAPINGLGGFEQVFRSTPVDQMMQIRATDAAGQPKDVWLSLGAKDKAGNVIPWEDLRLLDPLLEVDSFDDDEPPAPAPSTASVGWGSATPPAGPRSWPPAQPDCASYRPDLGLAVVEDPSAGDPPLLRVSAVFAPHPSVRPGQVITSLNLVPTRTMEEFLAALRTCVPGETVEVSFRSFAAPDNSAPLDWSLNLRIGGFLPPREYREQVRTLRRMRYGRGDGSDEQVAAQLAELPAPPPPSPGCTSAYVKPKFYAGPDPDSSSDCSADAPLVEPPAGTGAGGGSCVCAPHGSGPAGRSEPPQLHAPRPFPRLHPEPQDIELNHPRPRAPEAGVAWRQRPATVKPWESAVPSVAAQRRRVTFNAHVVRTPTPSAQLLRGDPQPVLRQPSCPVPPRLSPSAVACSSAAAASEGDEARLSRQSRDLLGLLGELASKFSVSALAVQAAQELLSEMQPQLGVRFGQLPSLGPVIHRVDAGGSGWVAGLIPGDVVESVNLVAVSTLPQLFRALQNSGENPGRTLMPGFRIPLVVRRTAGARKRYRELLGNLRAFRGPNERRDKRSLVDQHMLIQLLAAAQANRARGSAPTRGFKRLQAWVLVGSATMPLTEVARLRELSLGLSRIGGLLRSLRTLPLDVALQEAPELRALQITWVDPDGQLAFSGLRAGDYLLDVAGHRLASLAELRAVLARCAPGDRVELRCARKTGAATSTCRTPSPLLPVPASWPRPKSTFAEFVVVADLGGRGVVPDIELPVRLELPHDRVMCLSGVQVRILREWSAEREALRDPAAGPLVQGAHAEVAALILPRPRMPMFRELPPVVPVESHLPFFNLPLMEEHFATRPAWAPLDPPLVTRGWSTHSALIRGPFGRDDLLTVSPRFGQQLLADQLPKPGQTVPQDFADQLATAPSAAEAVALPQCDAWTNVTPGMTSSLGCPIAIVPPEEASGATQRDVERYLELRVDLGIRWRYAHVGLPDCPDTMESLVVRESDELPSEADADTDADGEGDAEEGAGGVGTADDEDAAGSDNTGLAPEVASEDDHEYVEIEIDADAAAAADGGVPLARADSEPSRPPLPKRPFVQLITVRRSGPFGRAGLRAGDRVLMANRVEPPHPGHVLPSLREDAQARSWFEFATSPPMLRPGQRFPVIAQRRAGLFSSRWTTFRVWVTAGAKRKKMKDCLYLRRRGYTMGLVAADCRHWISVMRNRCGFAYSVDFPPGFLEDPQAGVASAGRLYVTAREVPPGGVAHAAGLRIGDRLMFLAGRQVSLEVPPGLVRALRLPEPPAEAVAQLEVAKRWVHHRFQQVLHEQLLPGEHAWTIVQREVPAADAHRLSPMTEILAAENGFQGYDLSDDEQGVPADNAEEHKETPEAAAGALPYPHSHSYPAPEPPGLPSERDGPGPFAPAPPRPADMRSGGRVQLRLLQLPIGTLGLSMEELQLILHWSHKLTGKVAHKDPFLALVRRRGLEAAGLPLRVWKPPLPGLRKDYPFSLRKPGAVPALAVLRKSGRLRVTAGAHLWGWREASIDRSDAEASCAVGFDGVEGGRLCLGTGLRRVLGESLGQITNVHPQVFLVKRFNLRLQADGSAVGRCKLFPHTAGLAFMLESIPRVKLSPRPPSSVSLRHGFDRRVTLEWEAGEDSVQEDDPKDRDRDFWKQQMWRQMSHIARQKLARTSRDLGVALSLLKDPRRPEKGKPLAPELMVIRITRDGPAYQAGVRLGDIIQAVDGVQVASPQDLLRSVVRMRPGSRAEWLIKRFRVIRDNEPRKPRFLDRFRKPPPPEYRRLPPLRLVVTAGARGYNLEQVRALQRLATLFDPPPPPDAPPPTCRWELDQWALVEDWERRAEKRLRRLRHLEEVRGRRGVQAQQIKAENARIAAAAAAAPKSRSRGLRRNTEVLPPVKLHFWNAWDFGSMRDQNHRQQLSLVQRQPPPKARGPVTVYAVERMDHLQLVQKLHIGRSLLIRQLIQAAEWELSRAAPCFGWGLSRSSQGQLLVSNLEPGGAACLAGLRPGDALLSVRLVAGTLPARSAGNRHSPDHRVISLHSRATGRRGRRFDIPMALLERLGQPGNTLEFGMARRSRDRAFGFAFYRVLMVVGARGVPYSVAQVVASARQRRVLGAPVRVDHTASCRPVEPEHLDLRRLLRVPPPLAPVRGGGGARSRQRQASRTAKFRKSPEDRKLWQQEQLEAQREVDEEYIASEVARLKQFMPRLRLDEPPPPPPEPVIPPELDRDIEQYREMARRPDLSGVRWTEQEMAEFQLQAEIVRNLLREQDAEAQRIEDERQAALERQVEIAREARRRQKEAELAERRDHERLKKLVAEQQRILVDQHERLITQQHLIDQQRELAMRRLPPGNRLQQLRRRLRRARLLLQHELDSRAQREQLLKRAADPESGDWRVKAGAPRRRPEAAQLAQPPRKRLVPRARAGASKSPSAPPVPGPTRRSQICAAPPARFVAAAAVSGPGAPRVDAQAVAGGLPKVRRLLQVSDPATLAGLRMSSPARRPTPKAGRLTDGHLERLLRSFQGLPTTEEAGPAQVSLVSPSLPDQGYSPVPEDQIGVEVEAPNSGTEEEPPIPATFAKLLSQRRRWNIGPTADGESIQARLRLQVNRPAYRRRRFLNPDGSPRVMSPSRPSPLALSSIGELDPKERRMMEIWRNERACGVSRISPTGSSPAAMAAAPGSRPLGAALAEQQASATTSAGSPAPVVLPASPAGSPPPVLDSPSAGSVSSLVSTAAQPASAPEPAAGRPTRLLWQLPTTLQRANSGLARVERLTAKSRRSSRKPWGRRRQQFRPVDLYGDLTAVTEYLLRVPTIDSRVSDDSDDDEAAGRMFPRRRLPLASGSRVDAAWRAWLTGSAAMATLDIAQLPSYLPNPPPLRQPNSPSSQAYEELARLPCNLGFRLRANVRKDRLLVQSVVQGSPAFRAGICPGDVLHSIAKIPVRNLDELQDVLFPPRSSPTFRLPRMYPGVTLAVEVIRERTVLTKHIKVTCPAASEERVTELWQLACLEPRFLLQQLECSLGCGCAEEQVPGREDRVSVRTVERAGMVVKAVVTDAPPVTTAGFGCVLIKNIKPDGAAALSGLQPEDRICSVDGCATGSVAELRRVLNRLIPGDVPVAVIQRQEETMTLPLIVSAREAPLAYVLRLRRACRHPTPRAQMREMRPYLGFEVVSSQHGVRVVHVANQGPGKLAGLHEGDIVVAANGWPYWVDLRRLQRPRKPSGPPRYLLSLAQELDERSRLEPSLPELQMEWWESAVGSLRPGDSLDLVVDRPLRGKAAAAATRAQQARERAVFGSSRLGAAPEDPEPAPPAAAGRPKVPPPSLVPPPRPPCVRLGCHVFVSAASYLEDEVRFLRQCVLDPEVCDRPDTRFQTILPKPGSMLRQKIVPTSPLFPLPSIPGLAELAAGPDPLEPTLPVLRKPLR